MEHCLSCNEAEVNVPTCDCECTGCVAAIRKAFNAMGEWLGEMQDRNEATPGATEYVSDVCRKLEEVLDA